MNSTWDFKLRDGSGGLLRLGSVVVLAAGDLMAVDNFDLPPPSKSMVNQQAAVLPQTYRQTRQNEFTGLLEWGTWSSMGLVNLLCFSGPEVAVKVIVCIVAIVVAVSLGLLLDKLLGTEETYVLN